MTNPALWNWASPVWFVALSLTAASLWLCRGRVSGRSCWIVAAVAVLIAAFVSPIGVLANDYLFSAHTVQHLLLLLIVPLFLLLGLPPRRLSDVAGSRIRQGLSRLSQIAMIPWACGLGAMWLWHVPSLCSAATESPLLGSIRSLSFLLAGLAFWSPIYHPVAELRLSPPSAVVYLFSACVGCTLLGIYITFTPISVCPAFANPVDRAGILSQLYAAGLTPGADQQLGGLLMWVPPCALYVSVILSVLCRWYTAPSPSIARTEMTNSPSIEKVLS